MAIVTACSATSILLSALPLPGPAFAGGAAVVIAALLSGVRRCVGRGVPALLHVGIDRRLTVTDRSGRSCSGSILDDSYVGAAVTTIVWRADDDRWWRPARAMLILPDSLPRDDFRRLRVVLRYGRVVGDEGSSDVEAA
ncbi:MAG: hypothetical protein ABI724_09490 [Betaproteobacteria bacterium]